MKLVPLFDKVVLEKEPRRAVLSFPDRMTRKSRDRLLWLL